MVAKAIGRSTAPPRPEIEEESLESGLRENIAKQLQPLLERLKDRRVIVALFLLSYVPFGMTYWGAYQEYTDLRSRIGAQEAVLSLPEPRTDDIEVGLQSWTAALAAAKQAQVLELEDSNMLERLIAATTSSGIIIDSVSTSPNQVVPVGDEFYDTTPILIRVTGLLPGIESFITVLEDDAIEALEVQNSLVSKLDVGFGGTVRAIIFNRPIDPSELTEEERSGLSRRVSDEELDAAAAGVSGVGRPGGNQ